MPTTRAMRWPALEMLVVQDIFLTETAYLADVILPASAFPEKYRQLHQHRPHGADRPPGAAAAGPGPAGPLDHPPAGAAPGRVWPDYGHDNEQATAAVFDEMRRTMPSIAGITWDRLQREHSVTYPCPNEGDVGRSVVFDDRFPTATGKARFVPADMIPANERPDSDYPMVLITGRQLEHWHTGSMTRRASVLDAIEPDPVAMLHPVDLARLNIKPGDTVTIESRRGSVSLYARADDNSPPGAVFVPFCYYEAAINKLTNPALDPFGKIPEFKYCAVRISLGGPEPTAATSSYGGGRILAEATLD